MWNYWWFDALRQLHDPDNHKVPHHKANPPADSCCEKNSLTGANKIWPMVEILCSLLCHFIFPYVFYCVILFATYDLSLSITSPTTFPSVMPRILKHTTFGTTFQLGENNLGEFIEILKLIVYNHTAIVPCCTHFSTCRHSLEHTCTQLLLA